MVPYSATRNSAELYVIAVREIGKGIGETLVKQTLEYAKDSGYTEILLFSGEKHQDSWKFHDKHFDRIAPFVAPNGESGFIWRKILD